MIQTFQLPILPVKNTVVFPHIMTPISVGRARSLQAVKEATKSFDRRLVIISQRDAEVESPTSEQLYPVGTRVAIRRLTEYSRNHYEVVVEGDSRVELSGMLGFSRCLHGKFALLAEPQDFDMEVEALSRNVVELSLNLEEMGRLRVANGLAPVLNKFSDPLHKVYVVASLLGVSVEQGQALLTATTRKQALRQLNDILTYEIEVLETQVKIANRAVSEIGRENREYLLRQQLRAIQQELGDQNGDAAEQQVIRERLAKARLPEAVRKEVERDLGRWERLTPAAAEYNTLRSYLEFVAELPWRPPITAAVDLPKARAILDEDHFGLDDVKERILEYLAVMKINPSAPSPILCFVGPPGVGKTSLGRSIARALGRSFERISLGGLHDEADIRGHRRTYVGAMPGRILQAIRRAGANNAVLMLDEVDKLGRDLRFDPAAALLEVLDPHQNYEFHDHYLDLPFDLSRIFFIATANTLDPVPFALQDRMEILRLAGYTEEQKLEIASSFLLGKQKSRIGLPEGFLHLTRPTISHIIRHYTHEAGVRQLEQHLAKIARISAKRLADGYTGKFRVSPETLVEYLGAESFFPETLRPRLPAGVAMGTAWTEAGGEVLYIEAVGLKSERDLVLTGHMGDVMKESARAAISFVKSYLEKQGRSLPQRGIHIHIPKGMIPKDGPSAGLTMAVAVMSLFTATPVYNDIAMTGEISLTGLVLPVGGLREKVLAVKRAGLARMIVPRENLPFLSRLPDEIRGGVKFHGVSTIEEALALTIPCEVKTPRKFTAKEAM